MMVFQIEGISYVGQQQNIIDHRVIQLNRLIEQFKAPLRYNLYLHSSVIKHECGADLDDNFEEDSFSEKLNNNYIDKKILSKELLKTDFFLSLIYRPDRKVAGFSVHKSTRQQIINNTRKAEEQLGRFRELILDYFHEYEIKTLESYELDGVLYSSILDYLSLILNLSRERIPVMNAQISEYLATSTVTFGNNEFFIINDYPEKRYGAIITLSEYPTETTSGLLQPFLELPYKMCVTQTFIPIDKSEAMEWAKREQRRLISTDDASETEIIELDEALDGLSSDSIVLGDFYWSVMLTAVDLATLKSIVSDVRSTLSGCGYTSSVNVLAKMNSFFAQLPGNIIRQPRKARVSSINSVQMLPYQTQNRGKQWNNPWGCAISMLQTVNDEVFYFNFHDTEKQDDSKGELVLGNTVIAGQSGTGKTVLLSFLLSQAQRYTPRPRTIIFDKDLGSSVFVRAMGGKYSQIKQGEPTGFNPFKLENNRMNRSFINQLITAILQNDQAGLNATERNQIEAAINQVMGGAEELRDIEAFSNYLPDGEDSVRRRLYSWTHGEHSWVFNNVEDNFSFDTDIIGIDYTQFLDEPEIRSPILMYLFHRIELMLDGRKTIISLDEAWKPLSDPEFQKFIENKDRTIRKENGILVFATQSPSDFINGVSSSFMEQIATQIYLPNPQADQKDYVENLKLTVEEYLMIKNMHVRSRQFLIKYQGETTLCKLDLQGVREVDVLSGSEARATLADSLYEKHGDKWLEKYYESL